MIKEFCDICGEETKKNYVSDRLAFSKSFPRTDRKAFNVEVILGVGNVWNQGCICKSCLQVLLRDFVEGN